MILKFEVGIFKIFREMGGWPTPRAHPGRAGAGPALAVFERSSRPRNHSKNSRIVRDRFHPARTNLSKSLKHKTDGKHSGHDGVTTGRQNRKPPARFSSTFCATYLVWNFYAIESWNCLLVFLNHYISFVTTRKPKIRIASIIYIHKTH